MQVYPNKMSAKRRQYSIDYKIAALDYLKICNNVEKTAREFKIDSKTVRDWRKKEEEIRKVENVKKMRCEGGGRKVQSDELEWELANWIISRRQERLRVSRSMIKKQALVFFKDLCENSDSPSDKFCASNGWLEKFLMRHDFTIRKRTTVGQNIPADCTEKVVKFVIYMKSLRNKFKDNLADIFVMDETPIWLEPVSTTTVEKKGAKEVPLKSTGHEKLRVTVVLTAKADGTKCKPYFVVPRKRPIPNLENMKDMVFAYCGKSWMDDQLTEDYLRRVLGSLAFGPRLMVWDSFRCHLSQATKAVMRKIRIHMAVIPGGCTGLIQAPDVSWNRSLKSKIQVLYEEWMMNGPHEFTSRGSMRHPSFPLIAAWVRQAWAEIPTQQIIDSMKQCAVTNELDGSEDHLIECFKPGHLCHRELSQLSTNNAWQNELGATQNHQPEEDELMIVEEEEEV